MAKFQPGVSGNPGGRPKAEGHVRDLARAQTTLAIEALVEALEDPNGRVRVAAATALLDRGWGRPTQVIEEQPPEVDPVERLMRARKRANLFYDEEERA
ncbi:MAG: HEAT repeat domain-containing protein [Pseudomonas sp.]|nr:HEAT repeat domain-containing protein [Pseudomonas sp.]